MGYLMKSAVTRERASCNVEIPVTHMGVTSPCGRLVRFPVSMDAPIDILAHSCRPFAIL